MAWTEAHIKQLLADGKIKGYKEIGGKKSATETAAKTANANQIPKQTPAGLLHIKNALLLAGVSFVEEYQFTNIRKFRFDVAIPERKIAIEYEGLVSKKSRHTTLKGYSRDATKYNLATAEGWKVYRYTVANYREFNPYIR